MQFAETERENIQNEGFGWVSLQIEELRALRDFRMRNPQIEEFGEGKNTVQ